MKEEDQQINLGEEIRNTIEFVKNNFNKCIDLKKNCPSIEEKRNEFNKILENSKAYIKKLHILIKYVKKNDKGNNILFSFNQFNVQYSFVLEGINAVRLLSKTYKFPGFNFNHLYETLFENNTNLKEKMNNFGLFNFPTNYNIYDTEKFEREMISDFDDSKIKEINDYFNNINFNNHDLIQNEKILCKDGFLYIILYKNFIIKNVLRKYSKNKNFYFLEPLFIEFENEKIDIIKMMKKYSNNNYYVNKFQEKFYIKIIEFVNKILSESRENYYEKLNEVDFINIIKENIKIKTFTLFLQKFNLIYEFIEKSLKKSSIPITVKDIIKNDENIITSYKIIFNFKYGEELYNFYIIFSFKEFDPTKIFLIYSHYIINNHPIIYIENKEDSKLMIYENIKSIISNSWSEFKSIFMTIIYNKLKKLYPIYFDYKFDLIEIECGDKQICFSACMLKNHSYTKIFIIKLNEFGNLYYSNFFSDVLIKNFNTIDIIINNFLNNDNDEKYILEFNNYIVKIFFKYFCKNADMTCNVEKIDFKNKILNFKLNLVYFNENKYNCNFRINTNFNEEIIIQNKEDKFFDFRTFFEIKSIELITIDSLTNKDIIIYDCKNEIKQMKYYFEINNITELIKNIGECYNQNKLVFMNLYEYIKKIKITNDFQTIKVTKEIVKNKNKSYLVISEENIKILFKDSKSHISSYFNKIELNCENISFSFYLKSNIFKSKFEKGAFEPINKFSILVSPIGNIIKYDYVEDKYIFTSLSKLKYNCLDVIYGIVNLHFMQVIKFLNYELKIIKYLNEVHNKNCKDEKRKVKIHACPLHILFYTKNEEGKYIHFQFKINPMQHFFLEFESSYTNNIFLQYQLKEFSEDLFYSESKFNENYLINAIDKFETLIKLYNINNNFFSIQPKIQYINSNENIVVGYNQFNTIEYIKNNFYIFRVQVLNNHKILCDFKDISTNQQIFNLFILKLDEKKMKYQKEEKRVFLELVYNTINSGILKVYEIFEEIRKISQTYNNK